MSGEAAHPQLLNPHQLQISPPGDPRSNRRTARRRRNFNIGTAVEVQTDEEDFKSVYFSATVRSPPTAAKRGGRKKSRKIYVEYHNLLAHEDGSDRLREYVDVAFVRPVPPLQEIVNGFEPDDVVDAFYKDGWWTGVVTRAVEGGDRFIVTFRNPPDELEFGLAELRAHWDWVNGNWVRPQRQSIAGLMFDVGRKVEVSFDREELQDAWFPATIHEVLGNKTYVVEHNAAATDNNNGLACKATVDSLHIRPCPPLLNDKNFLLLEKVDAFFDFGWWSGVITKRLEDSRYLVYFKQLNTDEVYKQPELRPHMEWKNGQWFTSSQDPSLPFPKYGMSTHHSPGNSSPSEETAPVNNSVDGKDTCVQETQPSLISRKGHFKQLIPDNQKLFHVINSVDGVPVATAPANNSVDGAPVATAPANNSVDGDSVATAPANNSVDGDSVATTPVNNSVDGKNTFVQKTHPSLISRKGHLKKLIPHNQILSHVTTSLTKRKAHLSDSGGALSQPLKKLKEVNLVGANKEDRHDGSNKEVLSGFVSPESLNHMKNAVDQTTWDQSCSNHPWEENVQRKQRNSRTPQNASGKINSTSSSLGKSSAQILPLESLEHAFGEKESNTAGNTGEVAQNEHSKQETELPIIIGLPCAETGSLEYGISGVNRSQLSNKKIFTTADDQGQQGNNSTSPEIKDGKQLRIGVGSARRKRGRPRKVLIESTETLVTGNVEYRGVSSGDLNLKDGESQRLHEEEVIEMDASIFGQEKMTANQEKIGNGQSGSRNGKVRMTKPMLAGKHGEDGFDEPIRLGDNHSSKRGRKQIPSGKIAVKVRDFVGAPGGKATVVNRTEEVDKVFEPSNEFDNEPLSKWMEGIHMSSVIDGSRVLSLDAVMQRIVNGDNQGNVVVVDEATEKQPESRIQSSGLVDRGDVAPTESQSLPSVNDTVGVVLHTGTQKQSENGTQTASLVDGVSIVASEPQLPSVEHAFDALLVKDSEKRPENEPLSTGMVDECSTVPNQRRSSVEGTVSAVLDEDNEKRPENGMALALASVGKMAIPSEPENLPFVKNTVLWKTIESMEVFQRMPQKPHFQPLENSKESSREGLAIGFMVTFSSIVERTTRLQPDDPISTMDDIKETLGELEKHGFDVRVVQDCVNELLAMKGIEEKLVNDVDTLNNQITEHNHEKSRTERDIEEINGHIRKLQRKLEQAELAKVKKDEEIAFLLVRRRETEESIEKVRSGFKSVVSSIL